MRPDNDSVHLNSFKPARNLDKNASLLQNYPKIAPFARELKHNGSATKVRFYHFLSVIKPAWLNQPTIYCTVRIIEITNEMIIIHLFFF